MCLYVSLRQRVKNSLVWFLARFSAAVSIFSEGVVLSSLCHPLRKHLTRLVILCASLTNFVLVTVSLRWFSLFQVAHSNFLSLVLKGLNLYKTILSPWT